MSPLKDPLDPVKENIGSGTGIGTLTPTCRGKRTRVLLFYFYKWTFCETVVRHPKLLRRRRRGRRKMWCCVRPVQRKPTAITPNKAKLAAYIAVFKPNAWSYEREAKLNKTCFMKAEEDTACLVFRMFERTEEQFGKSEDFWQRCRAGGRRAAGSREGGKKREESTCLQRRGLERTALGLAQHSPTCEAQTQGITQAPQAKTNRFKRRPCLQLLYQQGQQESLLRIF